MAEDFELGSPGVLKDPRLLLTLDHWTTTVAKRPMFVATFRHPEAVVRSLWARDRLPRDDATNLWLRYNQQLIRLHKEHGFPLLEFDLSRREAYADKVIALAAELDLAPHRRAILGAIADRDSESDVPVTAAVPPSCAEAYRILEDEPV